MNRRLAIVGVMGSSIDEHADLAEPLGRFLAAEGVHLLTGAGAGVMEAVSRAFFGVSPRSGLVIGVVPGEVEGSQYRPRPGYPNAWVEVPIFTHLPLSGRQGTAAMSRNHLNVLSADVVVALPGSHGTAAEVALACRYHKPVVAFVRERDQIPELPAAVEALSSLEAVSNFVRHSLGGTAR